MTVWAITKKASAHSSRLLATGVFSLSRVSSLGMFHQCSFALLHRLRISTILSNGVIWSVHSPWMSFSKARFEMLPFGSSLWLCQCNCSW